MLWRMFDMEQKRWKTFICGLQGKYQNTKWRTQWRFATLLLITTRKTEERNFSCYFFPNIIFFMMAPLAPSQLIKSWIEHISWELQFFCSSKINSKDRTQSVPPKELTSLFKKVETLMGSVIHEIKVTARKKI